MQLTNLDVGTPEHGSRIQVTEADHRRLVALIDSWAETRDLDATDALAAELARAEVVPGEQIAGNVVTMNSRVVFEDVETGAKREVVLVYPEASDVAQARISVLAPVGTALLGLSVGQTINWPLPRGHIKRLRIVDVLYQPEGAGDLTL